MKPTIPIVKNPDREKPMRRRGKMFVVSLVIAMCAWSAQAVAVVIDFENYSVNTVIANQYADLGVVFSGPWSDIFTASLQSAYDPTWGYEFPPHSGNNALVASNEGDATNSFERITFIQPVSYASFYYTNGSPQGFEAFAYDDLGNRIDQLTYYWDLTGSPYIIYANNNYGYSVPQKPLLPNLFAEFSGGNIRYIDIQPNVSFNGGLVIDDLAFTVVPEPSSLVLAAFGLIALTAWGWRRKP